MSQRASYLTRLGANAYREAHVDELPANTAAPNGPRLAPTVLLTTPADRFSSLRFSLQLTTKGLSLVQTKKRTMFWSHRSALWTGDLLQDHSKSKPRPNHQYLDYQLRQRSRAVEMRYHSSYSMCGPEAVKRIASSLSGTCLYCLIYVHVLLWTFRCIQVAACVLAD